MKILVTNLTLSPRSISFPRNGRTFSQYFLSGQTIDISAYCTPEELDLPAGAELRNLVQNGKVSVVLQPEPSDLDLSLFQPQNNGGSTSNAAFENVIISYNAASPVIVKQLSIGNVIYFTSIHVDTAFNDSNATISLGTYANPSMFLSVSGQQLGVSGSEYENSETFLVEVPDFLILTINSASSSQGQVSLYYTIVSH